MEVQVVLRFVAGRIEFRVPIIPFPFPESTYAVTLWPFIFYEPHVWDDQSVQVHERYHWIDQIRWLVIPWLIIYFLLSLRYGGGRRHPLEKEAYARQDAHVLGLYEYAWGIKAPDSDVKEDPRREPEVTEIDIRFRRFVSEETVAKQTEELQARGLLARLTDGRPSELSPENVVEHVNEGVNGSVMRELNNPDSELFEHLQDHERASDDQAALRHAEERAQFRRTLIPLGAVGLAAVFAALLLPLEALALEHLATWPLSLFERISMDEFALILSAGVSVLAGVIAVRTYRRTKLIEWAAIPATTGAVFLVVGVFAVYWNLVTAIVLRIQPSGTVQVWILGVWMLLASGIVIYVWRASQRVIQGEESSARADSEARQGDLLENVKIAEDERDRITRDFINQQINTLSSIWGIEVQASYGLIVPDYDQFVTNAWEQLSENYDSYVKSSSGDEPYLDELLDYVKKLSRASIGIAGERGAGKTALMYAARNELRPDTPLSRDALDVWIGAPTSVTEEVFLLSALAKLAVGAGSRLTGNKFFPQPLPEAEVSEYKKVQRNMRLAIAAGIGSAILSIFIGLSLNLQIPLTAAIGLTPPILLLAWRQLRGLVLSPSTYLSPTHSDQYLPSDRNLLHACESLLEQLWFDQRETQGSSIKLGGVGIALAGGTSRERKRRPFTLPQLVQMWDDLVQLLTTGPGSFGRVVFFIDEVDKIKETAQIGRFMRILKTLYRPRRLFFVVSISEDAYEQFKNRAVSTGQRNEFDSSFDRFVWVDLMSYEDTVRLLNDKVVGDPLPRPFVQLIWAINKGNPRDTVRMARDVLRRFQEKELNEVAQFLINEYQLGPMIDQYRRALRHSLTQVDYDIFLESIDTFSENVGSDQAATKNSLDMLDSVIDRRRTAVERGQGTIEENLLPELWHVKIGLFYTKTLYDVFGVDARSGLEQRFEEIDQNGHLKLMKEAFHHLQANEPNQAWRKISDFKSAVGV